MCIAADKVFCFFVVVFFNQKVLIFSNFSTNKKNIYCGHSLEAPLWHILQPLYNKVPYNMVLYITWFKDGS